MCREVKTLAAEVKAVQRTLEDMRLTLQRQLEDNEIDPSEVGDCCG